VRVQPRSGGRGVTTAARLVYLGHATVLLELDGARLLTDPVLRSRVLHLRRRVPLPTEPLTELTAALVSHAHYDHLDLPSLRSLGPKVPVVVPRGARRALRRVADVRELAVGEEIRFGEVTVRATPAEHKSARVLHRSSAAVGYLVSGSREVYFAGDTDLFPGMAEISESLDLALIPVAGWGAKVGPGHLDPERAARAVQLLRPRLAVPIHWGTLSTMRASTSGEPAEAFRGHAAQLTPDVEVHVLEPGAALEF
jgi:L-ascorbate metabolism protein UlaG (beta-lactamase superfamily)